MRSISPARPINKTHIRRGRNETAARPVPVNGRWSNHIPHHGSRIVRQQAKTSPTRIMPLTRAIVSQASCSWLTKSRLSFLYPLPCHRRDWQLWWIDTGRPYRASEVPFSKVELASVSALYITNFACIPASLVPRRHSSVD